MQSRYLHFKHSKILRNLDELSLLNLFLESITPKTPKSITPKTPKMKKSWDDRCQKKYKVHPKYIKYKSADCLSLMLSHYSKLGAMLVHQGIRFWRQGNGPSEVPFWSHSFSVQLFPNEDYLDHWSTIMNNPQQTACQN